MDVTRDRRLEHFCGKAQARRKRLPLWLSYPEHSLYTAVQFWGKMLHMSDRLIKLLAELEYLRTLGHYLINECDKALQECSRLDAQEPPNEVSSAGPSLEN